MKDKSIDLFLLWRELLYIIQHIEENRKSNITYINNKKNWKNSFIEQIDNDEVDKKKEDFLSNTNCFHHLSIDLK